MVSYLVPLVWTIFFSRQRKNKEFVTCLFLPLLLPFTLKVGSSRISILYYICIVLLLPCLRKRLAISKSVLRYLLGLVLVLVINAIGWIFNGTGSFLSALVGNIKFIVLIVEICILLSDVKKTEIEAGFLDAVGIVVMVNFLVFVMARVSPYSTYQVVEMFFYNDDTINAANSIVDGTLGRAFGVFNHPSILAVFCLSAIVLYLFKAGNKEKRILYFAINIIMGIFSYSKLFFIGFPIIFILYLVLTKKMMSTKGMLFAIVLVILTLMFVLSFDTVVLYIKDRNPVLAYYLNYLKRPMDAFKTRYDSSTGNLAPLYTVIRNHLLVGVGPNSIGNEEVLDSAPLVILHDGGIAAMVVVFLTYVSLFIDSFRYKKYVCVLFLVIIFLSGFALPTWIFHSSTIALIIYILMVTSNYGTGDRFELNSNLSVNEE